VVNPAIHRVIEQQAAAQPDRPAVVARSHAITYRELNHRANVLARQLIASGLTRGGLALVKMERSPDLAVVLLAVLKAGGKYTWFDPHAIADDIPCGLTLVQHARGDERRHLALDLRSALADAPRTSPNLPILTRGSDVACVLPTADGSPHVLVPHSTITALDHNVGPRSTPWGRGSGAFDLWISLMTGGTVTVEEQPIETAAA
jgi:non-ribosomal peptide synthetase component F